MLQNIEIRYFILSKFYDLYNFNICYYLVGYYVDVYEFSVRLKRLKEVSAIFAK